MWKVSPLSEKYIECFEIYDTEIDKERSWETLKLRKIETIAVIAGSEHGMLSDQTIVSRSLRK